jgi:hypothetical protein
MEIVTIQNSSTTKQEKNKLNSVFDCKHISNFYENLHLFVDYVNKKENISTLIKHLDALCKKSFVKYKRVPPTYNYCKESGLLKLECQSYCYHPVHYLVMAINRRVVYNRNQSLKQG